MVERPRNSFGVAPGVEPPRPDASGPVATAVRSRDPSSVQVSLDELDDLPTHNGRATLSRLPPVGRFGRYDLLGRLAYGGMAEIFLARERSEHAGSGRFVVVKRVLPHVAEEPHFVEMFVDEARLAMNLAHPNICHTYAFGQEEGAYYLSMEWVNGQPLSKLIRRSRDEGGVAIPIALKIIAQVAEALDYAHRATDQQGEPLGIVHRDVSPQNVMVSYDGVVKLLDFGIAKAASHSTRTEAGVIKGKFAYMSPQQCLGEAIDARADVFALGVCLYETLTSKNWFKRQTEFDTMRALVYEDPPPLREALPGVPEDVEQLVRRALAKRPEERFQSAAEMQVACEHCVLRMGSVTTTSRIGDRMAELFPEEMRAGPQLDTKITGSLRPPVDPSSDDRRLPAEPGATQRVAAVTADAAAVIVGQPPPASSPKRRSPVALIAVLLSLFVLFAAAIAAIVVVFVLPQWGGSLMASLAPPTPVAASASPTVVAQPQDPVEPAVEEPTTASIFVDSAPNGAAILLSSETAGDRGEVGRTPSEIAMLEPGEWTVRLHQDGFEDWEDTVEVRAGERLRLFGELTAIPAERRVADRPRVARTDTTAPVREPTPRGEPGMLSVNTRPWSKVYVGSRLLGTTPIGSAEVEAGAVTLRFVDRDGTEHTRRITIPAGGHAREFFDLREGSEAAEGSAE